MDQDEKFMKTAIGEALQAKREGNLPFGAIVVLNDEIIGNGHSTEIVDNDVTSHAETKAVSKACRKMKSMKLGGATLYVSGEPCNMCAAAIFQAKISRVVIGSSREDIPGIFRKRKIGIRDLAQDASYKPEVVFGVLTDKAIKLFSGAKF